MKTFTHRRLQRTAAIALVAGTAGLGIGGAAFAASPSTTTPSSPAPSAGSPAHGGAAKGHHHAGDHSLLRRAVHAEVVVKTKTGYRTLELDRGTVNSVSTSAISITRPDGPVVTATVNATTRFRGQTEAQLAKGSPVLVVQTGGAAVDVLSRPGSAGGGTSGAGSTGTGATAGNGTTAG